MIVSRADCEDQKDREEESEGLQERDMIEQQPNDQCLSTTELFWPYSQHLEKKHLTSLSFSLKSLPSFGRDGKRQLLRDLKTKTVAELLETSNVAPLTFWQRLQAVEIQSDGCFG